MSTSLFTLSSSSRLLSLSTNPRLTRGVLHIAKPPRRPAFASSPLSPLSVSPSAGTSRAQPNRQSPTPLTSTTLKDDPDVELVYAPPPSMKSYTNGEIPDVMKWLGGMGGVRSSEQRGAPRRKGVGEEQVASRREDLELSAEIVAEIKSLRMEDPVKWTRSALIKRFNLPSNFPSSHLARLVPSSTQHRTKLAEELEMQKQGWGFRKRVGREMREVRKGMW